VRYPVERIPPHQPRRADRHGVLPTNPTQGRIARGYTNPILSNLLFYDVVKTGPSCVLYMGAGDYRQWYEGLDDTVGPSGGSDNFTLPCYATSADGTSWAKYAGNPIVDGTVAWEKSEVSPSSVVYDPIGATFRMHYHGGNNSGPRAIGTATSADGISWTKYGSNPVLQRNTGDPWEAVFVADAKVIPPSPWLNGGPDLTWRMYYCGVDSGGARRFGLATSTDGITWTKYAGNPVFNLGAGGQWDDNTIMAFCPFYENGIFHAWYVADDGVFNSGIGYAWSNDGVTWTRGASNPVAGEITGDSPQDSIHVYRDPADIRIVYGQYDLGASPALRGKGEAFLRRGARGFGGTTADVIELAVESDFDFDRTSPFTVAAWVYVNASGGNGGLVMKQQTTGAQGWALYLTTSAPAGAIGFDLRASGAGAFNRNDSSGAVPSATWTHACATYDGSNTVAGIKLYKNGTATAMNTLDNNLTASILNAAPVKIGARGDAGTHNFPMPAGRVAQVLVWNAELTAAEVAQVAEGGPLPRRASLVAFVPFDTPTAQQDLAA
jgi:hypothetical protein